MDGCGDGGSNQGGERELIDAVLTCEGNISDPELPTKLSHLIRHLKVITRSVEDWLVRKVEPWNSVRVTFSIPKEAAVRLRQLAQSGDAALRQLGILSVQVEGDQIVSLKVAGPNNETAEILLRTDGVTGSSGHSDVARSVTQALGGAGMLPGFSHQHHQPHPVPQFRSPSLVAADGIPVVVGRTPVVQQRPQGQQQTFTYTGLNTATAVHSRPLQQQSPIPPASNGTHVAGVPSSSLPSPVISRPVFPANPPPPYPNQEIRQSVNVPPVPPPPLPLPQPQQVVASASQISGQPYVVNQAHSNVVSNSPNPHTGLQQQQHPQINSVAQPVTGTYQLSGSQVSVSNNGPLPPGRGPVRTQVNMVKNSPLLVGLLQQPEQTTPIVGTRTIKNPAILTSQQLSQPSNPLPSNSVSVENGPLPSAVSNLPSPSPHTFSGTSTYIGRSRDGLTTHQQIYSGGSVITSTAPPPPSLHQQRHVIPSGFQQQPHGNPTPTGTIPRLQQPLEEQRRVMAAPSLAASNNSSKVSHLQQGVHDSSGPTNLPFLNSKLTGSHIDHGETNPSIQVPNTNKKESQYLINPNTGLLEPRPSTDSSDSETEGRTLSPPHDDQHSNSLASDEESNISAASRKETDHSDSDVSRISATSIESRKVVRGKSRDRDSSPVSSWDNSVISSSPGEKIKLRLKLGKEQVAQATIVGNAAKKIEKKEVAGVSGGNNSSPNIIEPRVPKLHIKLHSRQPVIIKPVEEVDSGIKKFGNKDGPREEKVKKKGNRNKCKSSEVKNVKLKTSREKLGEDVASQVLKILEPKRTKPDTDFDSSPLIMKLKDSADMRHKVPRLNELSKLASKVDSKLRTRVKKPPMRKVGDLNSVGEIASHKILETLPPSITRVAAMHTQHPHHNPCSSSPTSPVPLSSITPTLFSGSSISATFSSSTSSGISPAPTSDQLKVELEKRGSEIIPKSEVRVDGENDILMTKLKVNPQLKGMMNGDVPHSDRVSLNSMRYKRASSFSFPTSDYPASSKLTIKRKCSDEMHTLETLKKEGLGSVPTFLNSSVLINKVSDKNIVSGLAASHRHGEDFPEKFLNSKAESLKSPRSSGDISGLKSNSDITIHSVSKNESLGLGSKGGSTDSLIDRRPNLIIKPKSEVTKVGRVTCVDVMDRKALEEALKSSRNSSKKKDVSFSNTSSMVDRLRRWNSIDSSTSVPFSSHSQQQTGESTNLYSMGVKVGGGTKESGTNESEKHTLGLSTIVGKKVSVSQQANTVNSVNNIKSDCDNSGKDIVDKNIDRKNDTNSLKSKVEEVKAQEGEAPDNAGRSVEAETKPVQPCVNEGQFLSNTSHSLETEMHRSSSNMLPIKPSVSDNCKLTDLVNTVPVTKPDVDSPEGTPKGEHGSGQGEDSGIESMDALSEKSPNHSDQSPNRREDKDCEMFHDKSRDRNPGLVNPRLENKDKLEVKSDDNLQLEKDAVSVGFQTDKPDKQVYTGADEERLPVNSRCPLLMARSDRPTSHLKSAIDTCNNSNNEALQTESSASCCSSHNSVNSCSSLEMDAETKQMKDTSAEEKTPQNQDSIQSHTPEPTKWEPVTNSEYLADEFNTDVYSLSSSCPVTENLEHFDSHTNKLVTDSDQVHAVMSSVYENASSAATMSASNHLHDIVNMHSADFENNIKMCEDAITSAAESVEAHASDKQSKENAADRLSDYQCEKQNSVPYSEMKNFEVARVKSETSETENENLPCGTDLHEKDEEEGLDKSYSNPSPGYTGSTKKASQMTYSQNFIRNAEVSEEPVTSSQDTVAQLQSSEFFSDSQQSVELSRSFTTSDTTANNTASVASDFLSSAVCSTSLSVTTTSISVSSPRSSLVMSPSIGTPEPIVCLSPSLSASSSPACSEMSHMQECPKDSSALTSLRNPKPSVVAITLGRPSGGAIIPSRFVSPMTNSLENCGAAATTTVMSKSCSALTPVAQPATAFCKTVSSLEYPSSSSSIVLSHSMSCNNNTLAYSSSYSTTNTITTATMIILAASSSNSSAAVTTSQNSTRVVTLKPGINQTSNSSINPPVGKTFRLVALPGINSMNPVASPVKGQLVTLKPVLGTGVATSIGKTSQLLQTTPALKNEEAGNSSILKSHLSSPLIASLDSPSEIGTDALEGRIEDLDFVGFCTNSGCVSTEETGEETRVEMKKELPLEVENIIEATVAEILSPAEEEPQPMRVHPPLYTYGNRERKKEVESDVEDKEKEELKESVASSASSMAEKSLSDVDIEVEKKDDDHLVRSKVKEKKLDALTIEIPNIENYPDDKRLTRSTRQSARLASPKVNSPVGELSPRLDKRSNSSATQLAMGKPSPVGILRSSTSPALRVTKRRRHESESSNASTVSEDMQEPPVKVSKRRLNESREEAAKSKTVKTKDIELDRVDGTSSDEESLAEDDSSSKKRDYSAAASANDDDEDMSSRPVKAITRSRERVIEAAVIRSSRDTTPTRRTPRQSRIIASSTSTAITTGTTAVTVTANQILSQQPQDVKENKSSSSSTSDLVSPPVEELSQPTSIGKEKVGQTPSRGEITHKEGDRKGQEKKLVATSGSKEVVIKALVKGKRELENEQEALSGRRKTRSTTSTAAEDANKRRRLSKDNKQ